ncbi:DNA repair protein RadA [Mobiluncus mulieris]|uniref:DNA repair protein RadA n=1 Tax=Mobiluncus mulieris TaxID=2052 RepID=UPI00242F237F|nr:AAA family ATPase [Mobiluncus mulieris]
MAKSKTVYVCGSCGEQWPKWAGQCRACGEWGTLEESVVGASGSGFMRGQPAGRAGVGKPASPARAIGTFEMQATARIPSGVAEFDRVLAGGVVPGAVILLAGEPGIGKSTLLLEVAAAVARGDESGELNKATGETAQVVSLSGRRGGGGDSGKGRRVLYLTGEETAQQVYSRARRIGALADELLLAAETSVDQALSQIEAAAPALTIVDSIQTLTDPLLDTSIGGPAQVREVTAKLTAAAKSRNMGLLLVGHVTKDGAVAGPRTLEHLVDVVLQFEGERTGELRLLRAVKNRYGPTDAVGFFQMAESGIEGITDPSGLFLSQTAEPVPGSCVTMSLEGRRALPIEIEALATPMAAGSPRRTVSGLDYSRVSMMLAVLQARMKLPLGTLDAYVSTVGGARAVEPAVDLAVALAAASAVTGQVIDHHLVALGEVSLTGEIRSCTALSRRLAEAARLGFTTAVVPAAGAKKLSAPRGLSLRTAKNLREALALALHPSPDA